MEKDSIVVIPTAMSCMWDKSIDAVNSVKKPDLRGIRRKNKDLLAMIFPVNLESKYLQCSDTDHLPVGRSALRQLADQNHEDVYRVYRRPRQEVDEKLFPKDNTSPAFSVAPDSMTEPS
jgi:hypothetical protein